MLKKLRTRLLWIYMLTTVLLLLVILVVLYSVNLKQYTENSIKKFEGHVRTITEELITEKRVFNDWLSKVEAESQLLIFISSNSVPLGFPGSWNPPTERQVLLERFRDLLDKSGEGEGKIYSFYGEYGDHYYGYSSFSKSERSGIEIIILQWMMNENSDRLEQGIFFFFLSLAAVLAVYVISRILVKKSLQPLKEGLARQNEFIAAASHELRSPLTVMMAGLGSLKLDCTVKEDVLPCMEREGNRMAKLIQDMLLIASSDAKTWDLHVEEIEPETFFIHIYETLVQICRKKSQKPIIILPEEELSVFSCDRMRLEQILMILSDNACSYTEEGSEITIRVSETKKNLIIEVIDHGQGISEEEKKRIFERFYRSDRSRNDKTHFGLGLSIAVELVNLLKGRLSVCDTEGGGSTFVVELPFHASKNTFAKK